MGNRHHAGIVLDYQAGGMLVLALPHTQQGVSLVELMIGLVIAGILLGIGAPALSVWIQNGKIRAAAESIQNGLQLTRAEAVRRNSYVRFSLSGTSNVNSYWTVGCFPVDPLSCPDTTIESHSANEGTSSTIVNSNVASVTFNGLGRTTAGGATINVTNSTGGSALRVVVSSFGQVRMCDPAYSYATNPKGC